VRRSRSDTMPLVAQSVAPRLLTVGLDGVTAGVVRGLVSAAEHVQLELAGGLAAIVAGHEPDLVVIVASAETLPLVRELKLLPETHFIPVIACGPAETRLPAYSAGVDHWIGVPVPEEETRIRASALLRTAALSRALRQSRQELRLRRDWVRYLVHDLRNLLTKAIGDLAMATRKTAADPSAAGELMARCEEELWRCSALLNDLVDVDRIRKGMLNLRRAATDLVALARSTTGSFAAIAQRTHVTLELRAEAPSLVALVDAALVERVIANLLSNALRYAPEGTAISVAVRADAAARRAVLEVENRGPSIPPDKVDEIFEPFVQAESGSQAAGAGLGLAFCRLTVEMHGGAISVSEPEGGGARFRVELPGG
jgi:two-component system, sensor histidine kinase and response regulator